MTKSETKAHLVRETHKKEKANVFIAIFPLKHLESVCVCDREHLVFVQQLLGAAQ